MIELPANALLFDSYERGRKLEEIVVRVVLPAATSDLLQVRFLECRVKMSFRSRDTAFLDKWNADEMTVFVWAPRLAGRVEPSRCSHAPPRLGRSRLELTLWKLSPADAKWPVVFQAPPTTPVEPRDTDSSPTDDRLVRKSDQAAVPRLSKPTCKVSPYNKHAFVSTPGFTGLFNMGNTCYMNATLQTLINCSRLNDYFTEGRHKAELNTENKLGTGGQLARAFSSLLRSIWTGEHVALRPAKIKDLVAQLAPQFGNQAQHDSQEFVCFLLDGLHEDLNRAATGSRTQSDSDTSEHSDADVEPEEEARRRRRRARPRLRALQTALRSWRQHLARNDSIIVDTFYGQFKSRLQCAQCKLLSISYDPFIYMPVPFPLHQRTIRLVYFADDPTTPPTELVERMCVSSTIRQLLDAVSRTVDVPPQRLRAFEEYSGRVNALLELSARVDCIKESDSVFVAAVLDEQTAGEPVVEVYVSQELASKRYSGAALSPQSAFVGKPFLLSLPASRATYRQLEHMIQARCIYSVDAFQKPVSGDAVVQPRRDAQSAHLQPAMLGRHAAPGDMFTLHRAESKACLETKPLADRGAEPLELVSDGGRKAFLVVRWADAANGSVLVRAKAAIWPSLKMTDSCKERPLRLENMFLAFTEPETLSDAEAWKCPSCKLHRAATKTLTLWRLPTVLIVQLKRFLFADAESKIDTAVELPVEGLDMRPFVCDAAPTQDALYDLSGVVCHAGTLHGGHYTAFARLFDGERRAFGEWRRFDDDLVSKASEADVRAANAYLLLYQRRSLLN